MDTVNTSQITLASEDSCSYGELYTNLEKLIQDGTFNNKKIVLFGAGLPSRKILQYLQEKQYTAHAVIDNNPKAWGTDFEGLTVSSPEEELGEFQDNAVILIASSHHKAMREQLENLTASEKSYIEGRHIFELIDYEQLEKNIYNMIPEENILSLEDIQRELYKILKYLKKICEENNLSYFLNGGTLLGAIRHQGFIPWDDDVDVVMPFNDYKKMIDIVRQEGIYDINNNETRHSFKYGYSQIINPAIFRQKIGFPIHPRKNLFIDIFPIYSVPDDAEKKREVLEKNRQLKTILNKHLGYDNTEEEYIRAKKDLITMWEEIGYHPTKEILTTTAEGTMEAVFSYQSHASALQKKFVDEYFSVPAEYENVLTTLYGDYMQLPPEEKRVSSGHGIYYYE